MPPLQCQEDLKLCRCNKMTDHSNYWLESLASRNDLLRPKIMQLNELYSRKLWHELTVELEKKINDAEFTSQCPLLELYHNFIAGFADKINPLNLSLIAVAASKEMVDPHDGQTFLQGVLDQIQGYSVQRGPSGADESTAEASLYLEMQLAQYYLIAEDTATCKGMLDKGLLKLESLSEVNNKVAAAVHYVAMQYSKSKSDYAAFYRSALMYLAHTAQEEMSEEFCEAITVDVSLAALLGTDVYNFGELLMHPVMEVLRNSASYAWLYDILECFHQGDIPHYEALCCQHAAILNAQPALVANERHLKEKITVLCLLSFASSLPADEKTASLSDIAKRTGLTEDGVEFLLMKAFSLNLIRGVINGVKGTVSISWVAPRVLTLPEIEAFKDKVGAWLERVDKKAQELEKQSVGIAA